MRAVIFDLDDTLVYSSIDFKKMKSMVTDFLESAGVTHSLLNDQMLNFEIENLTVEDLRRKGFPEEEIKRTLAKVTEMMNRVELESLDGATLIEGVPETLKALKAKGLKIGIITRGCREYTEKVLAKFELRKYIDAVAARDDVEKAKPDPEHAFHLLRLLSVTIEEALLVGDHWSDAECAKKAGLGFVLVRRRGQNIESFKEYNCQAINSIKDIIKVV